MRYCAHCGHIIDEYDLGRKYDNCLVCDAILLEDDMTALKYAELSEQEKDEYELKLLKTIQSSPMFDERLYNMYNKYGTANFYYYFRFDKYEQMTGKKAGRKMTKEESDDLKQHMQATYGKGSKLYEEQVVQNCIEAHRVRKQESSNTPHCPTCGSANIKRITGTERATSVIGLGIFSKKINKSYKCLRCKCTW